MIPCDDCNKGPKHQKADSNDDLGTSTDRHSVNKHGVIEVVAVGVCGFSECFQQ